jgi:FtsH-binding integral membrane protein
MSYSMEYPVSAADARADARATFIRKTYGHLAGAILAFIGVEYLLLQSPFARDISLAMMGGRMSWMLVLGAFMVVSWVATSWAQSDTSRGMQYLGLSLYVLAEAIIFLPLLWIADMLATQNPQQYGGVIQTAAILTLAVFGGLTLAVLLTKRDFSFLGPILSVASMLALGAIIAGAIFGFNLGLFFCFAMVALASGYIIYQTSNVVHNFRTDQYVAASLALFASVALLFWYILQIILMSRGRD